MKRNLKNRQRKNSAKKIPGDISSGVLKDRLFVTEDNVIKFILKALGLTEQEQLEVYRAVVERVKNRFVEAREG